MIKGIKKGALVTFYAIEFHKRIYGRLERYLGNNFWAVRGSWGLRSAHQMDMKVVVK